MRLQAKFDASGSAEVRAAQPARPSVREQDHDEKKASPSARNLALAYHVERMIERGLIADYTQAARMLGVSQPRMTHLMGLLLLAPAIQEAILLGEMTPKDKDLRVVTRLAAWEAQEAALRAGPPSLRT